jgi:hypothetical protein
MTQLRMRRLALSILCAAAVSAIGAASAFADSEPGYFKFTNGAIAGAHFTASTGSVTLRSAHQELACTSSSLSGEFGEEVGFSGTQHVRDVVESFKGCTYKAGEGSTKLKCPEVAASSNLRGTLGVIDQSEHPVGLELEGEAGGEAPEFLNVKCGGWSLKFSGHVIGRLNMPPNTPYKKDVILTFAGTGAKQGIEGFEGGPTGLHLTFESNNVFPHEASSLTSEDTFSEFKNTAGENTELEIAKR